MNARYLVQAQGNGYMSRAVGGLIRVNVREVAHQIADQAARAQKSYRASLRVTLDDGTIGGKVVSIYRWNGASWSHFSGRKITGLDGREAPPARGW